MSTLEILGREHSGDEALCFSVDGYESSATTVELAALRQRITRDDAPGHVEHDGIRLDESQLTTLIDADAQPQVLWPLEVCHCGDDATVLIDGEPNCHGHAAAFDALVDEQIAEAVGA